MQMGLGEEILVIVGKQGGAMRLPLIKLTFEQGDILADLYSNLENENFVWRLPPPALDWLAQEFLSLELEVRVEMDM